MGENNIDNIGDVIEKFIAETNMQRMHSKEIPKEKLSEEKSSSERVTISLRMSKLLRDYVDDQVWKNRTDRSEFIISILIKSLGLEKDKDKYK